MDIPLGGGVWLPSAKECIFFFLSEFINPYGRVIWYLSKLVFSSFQSAVYDFFRGHFLIFFKAISMLEIRNVPFPIVPFPRLYKWRYLSFKKKNLNSKVQVLNIYVTVETGCIFRSLMATG